MASREDINKYYNGCSRLINATVLPHGGFAKRPGTIYVATAANSCCLKPFEFSVDDSMILEFSNLLLRFYKDGAIINAGVGTEDLSAFDIDYTIDAVDTVNETFTISDDGDLSSLFPVGAAFRVFGSTGNDGWWQVTGIAYSDPDFVITVGGDVTNAVADGEITLTLGHWKLNDNAADTAVDNAASIGATMDGTSNVNTSVMHKTGRVGTGCLDFTGTNYVSGDATHSFGDGIDTPFTILAWIYVTGGGGTRTIVSKWDETGAQREYYFELDDDEKLKIAIYDDTPDKLAYAITDDALTAGWHFVAATYDGGAGATAADGLAIYVDGSAVDVTASNDANYVSMRPVLATMYIGAKEDVGGVGITEIYDNRIDELAIFYKELSAANIATLYTTSAYSIVSPYTSAESFEIHTTQSADVMYIAHEDHHPQKLSRYGDSDWTIADVGFTGGPFLDENTTSTYLVGFARTGGTARSGYYFPAEATGTLTATGGHAPFDSNMVGALWLIKHTRPDNIIESADNDDHTTPADSTKWIKVYGDYTFDTITFAAGETVKLWRREGNGNWQVHRTFTAATAYSASESSKDTYYAFTRDKAGGGETTVSSITAKNQINRGIVKITGFTSSTVVTCEVVDAVLSDNATDNAVTTSMWAEGAWSDYRGYPRTVSFYEDRLWWASSTYNPDNLWSSVSSDYENMAFTDLGADDEAITAPIMDNEISQVQWMMARQLMAVGAANREYRFGASNPDNAVTPTDRKATPQTGFSSSDVQPVLLNDSIFFLQRQGKKLGAMRFDSITENFDVNDATLLAYGLLDSTPTTMAVQRSPDSIIWLTRTDGILPTFTYEPKEEVSGWARQIFGNSSSVETATGYVESAAVIHGSTEDEVWISIRRTINSATVYYVEKFAPRDWGTDVEDAIFCDSSITATAYPQMDYLVAFYNLDETTGTDASDCTGDHDGTINADASLLTTAGSNTALCFNFADSYNVTVPYHADFDFSGTAFSIGAWVYVSDQTSEINIIAKDDGIRTGTYYTEYYIEIYSGLLILYLEDSDNSAYVYKISDAQLSVGWHHISVTYDGSGGATAYNGITLYVDGSEVAATGGSDGTYSAMNTKSYDFYIGDKDSSGIISTKVDSLAIWKGVELSAAEVATLYSTSDTISGLDHLEGEEVVIFADGEVFTEAAAGDFTVSSGAITVTCPFETAQIGLAYTMKARTMRLAVPMQGNTLQTRIKRIHSVVVRFVKSLLGSAGAEDDSTEYLTDIEATYSTTAADTTKLNRLNNSNMNEQSYVTIVSDDPVPFTALSTVISFEVEEKR